MKKQGKPYNELYIDAERYAANELDKIQIENRTIRSLIQLEIAKAYYQGFIDAEEYHEILAF